MRSAKFDIARSRASTVVVATLLAGLAGAQASAQVFERLVGTTARDTAEGLRNTRDEGFISVGNLYSQQQPPRLHVIKYKQNGFVDWNTAWGSVGPDQGYSITESRADTFLAAGRTQSFVPNLGLGLLHLDPTGGVIFARTYRGDSQFSDLVNVNNTPSVSVVNVDDAAGNINFTVATSISQFFGPNFNGQFGQLLRVDFSGAPIFNNAYFDPFLEGNTRIAFTDLRYDRPNDHFVISGTVARLEQPTPGGPPIVRNRMLFVRTDSAGNVIFALTYGLPMTPDGRVPNLYGDGIDIDVNGDVVIEGHSDLFQQSRGAVVARFTPGGAPVWGLGFKDFEPHWRAVHVNADRTIGLVGTQTIASPAAGPMALVTMTPAGVPIFRRVYGPTTPPDMGKALSPLHPPACGWALIGEKSTAAAAITDLILARTDTNGRTGCFEQPVDPAFAPLDLNVQQISLVQIRLEGAEVWPGEPTRPPLNEQTLCLSSKACPGDTNGDGVVNFADITTVLANFGATYPLSCIGAGDANGDGVVNFSDNTVVLANFGTVCP